DREFDRIRLPTDRTSRDSLILDLRERQRAAAMAPSAPAEPAELEAIATGGAETRRADGSAEERAEPAAGAAGLDTVDPGMGARAGGEPRRRRNLNHPLWWTVMIVLLVSALASAWHHLSGRLEGEALDLDPAPAANAEP